MIDAHGVEAVRRAEAVAMAGLPDGALMQRAAAALASVVLRLLRERTGSVYGCQVVVLVGPGANGGDALWAGARLARRGVSVRAVLTHDSPHAGGLAGLHSAGGRVLDATEPGGTALAGEALSGADVVVDGLLGIGGRAGLRGMASSVVEAIGRLDKSVVVVAVDLPSGVDPDTGEVDGAHVRADMTVTFGTAKPCLLLPPAAAAAGRVHVVDIGLDRRELGSPAVQRFEAVDAAARWPVPGPSDDKYSRGVLGVVAGGATYTGAAVLCSGAAVGSGAGMVRYVGPAPATDLVRARWPEVVPGAGRVQAWVLGPGVDPDDFGQADVVRAALDGEEPCLVDAGALQVLALQLRVGEPVTAPLLLTPHAGELARLLADLGEGTPSRQEIEAQPLRFAREAVGVTGATVLLKGATTLVVSPDGRVLSQDHGPHWLATAGSGDVLAGIVGTLLAAGLEPMDAAGAAVVVHGRAGALASGGGPVSAGSLLDHLPAAVAVLSGGSDRPACDSRNRAAST